MTRIYNMTTRFIKWRSQLTDIVILLRSRLDCFKGYQHRTRVKLLITIRDTTKESWWICWVHIHSAASSSPTCDTGECKWLEAAIHRVNDMRTTSRRTTSPNSQQHQAYVWLYYLICSVSRFVSLSQPQNSRVSHHQSHRLQNCQNSDRFFESAILGSDTQIYSITVEANRAQRHRVVKVHKASRSHVQGSVVRRKSKCVRLNDVSIASWFLFPRGIFPSI